MMIKFILNSNCYKLIIVFVFMAIQGQALAQEVSVSGVVTDSESGDPLIGVTVSILGTSTGTISDFDGNYTIKVPNGESELVFSYVGYLPATFMVGSQSQLNVSLQPDVSSLEEVVVVGYGTQKRQSVTGAISQISGEELMKAPVGNITNMLGGRVPGVISLQQSGQPGADASSILVRGSSAKYIVDGVERSIAEIDPNTIESISVLKDASSAAVYGLDANAVIIVTTKRGKIGSASFSATANYGVSANAVMLEMLDGPGYAFWYNKAREMDGDAPVFTSEHVAMMLNDDPADGWGNSNWYEETFDLGVNQSFNINSTGGSENFKYFVSLGNFNQEGNVKDFNYNRFNLRSNIDATIANNLELTFDISGRIEDRKRPGFSASPGDWNNIPQQAIRAHPYVPMEIDGVPVSTRTASSYVSPIAGSELSGYNNTKSTILQTNFSLDYKMPFIEGLQAKFLAAYDISYQTSKQFSTPYNTYVANTPTATTEELGYTYTNDPRGTNASLVEGLAHSTRFTTNTSLNYSNRFGSHRVSALALMETRETKGNNFAAYGYGFNIYELDELNFATLDEQNSVGGGSYERTQMGFVGRINYDYDDRYLLEISSRYDGSYVFGGMVDGKRWGLFPAGSVGWRVSEESWFENSRDVVNNLKFRAGVGLTGTTEIPPYYFLNTLSFLRDPAVVLGGVAQNGLLTSRPGNINLTWAKALQYNVGLDATLYNGLLGVEFDVFYKYIYDMLSSVDATYPDSYGGYVYGYENNNEQDHKGFEISLSHRNSINEFNYGFSVNGTYTKRRWLKYGDSENTPDWLKLTGKEVGSQVGFIAEGLFQSQEEIDNSPLIVGKDVRVGDIKYRDRNGDGVVSYEQDRGYIGKSAYPKFVGGFSFDAEWRGIDLSVLFQGAIGRDVALTGVYSNGVMDNTSMTRPFYHGGNSPVHLVENSWTEENTSGEFPRLSLVPASSNNAYSSSFWYRNGDYLRLKTLQIGYNFPQLTSDSGIKSLRIYVEGQNLLTFSGLTKYNIDPEMPGVSNGYYPQQQLISSGVNFTF
ncbi:MAG TPA: TonB-dependent receptor [Gillisia sp.]|nr:TonB-dependent receptor [Gillisia sp.]